MSHPAIALDVELTRLSATAIRLWYVITGDIGVVRLADWGEPERVDGLWKTTCFEAFLRHGDGPGYDEINIASSRQWAAYQFDGYRGGMRDKDMAPPEISVARIPQMIAVGADFDAAPAIGHRASRLALSAVIEETDGAKSYWALSHPPGAPDFHHPDCFSLKLPASG